MDLDEFKKEFKRYKKYEEKIKQMKAIGDIKGLIRLLSDKDFSVSFDAFEALKDFRSQELVNCLIEAINQEDFKEKREAVELIGYAGEDKLVNGVKLIDFLINTLFYGDENLKDGAMFALRRIKDVSSVPRIITGLECENLEVKINCILILEETYDRRAVMPIVNCLKDTDSRVRYYAAKALKSFKDPQTVEVLIKHINDPNKGVRGEVLWALNDIGDSRAVEPLIEAVKNDNPEIQLIGYALKRIKKEGTIKELLNLLKSEDEDLRARVVRTLWFMEVKEVVEPLMELFAESRDHPKVRAEIVRALGYLRDKRAKYLIAGSFWDPDETVRKYNVLASMTFGDSFVDKCFDLALRDPDLNISNSLKEELQRLNNL